MKIKILFKILHYSGLPFLFRRIRQKRTVSIFLFHNPAPENFLAAIQTIKKQYNIISFEQFLEAANRNDYSSLPNYPSIITFDDGHEGNYKLLPVFREEKIIPTIFLCSGIVNTRKGFWFNNVPEDIDRENLKKIPNSERVQLLKDKGFDQNKEKTTTEALKLSQIKEMNPYVNFQSHTITHPILPNCSDEEAWNEISNSKTQLEDLIKTGINSFAYPNGDYCERDIEMVKKAGYECAFTVDPGYNSITGNLYTLKRLSLNDSADKYEVVVKASGFWASLRLAIK